MKYIIISADGETAWCALCRMRRRIIWRNTALSFCDTWLHTNPDAEPYRMGSVVSCDEKDFIKYLNTWIFPEQPSVFIENIGQVESDADILEKYRECPVFHF